MTLAPVSLFAALAAMSFSAVSVGAQVSDSVTSSQPKLVTPIRAIMPISLHNTQIEEPKVLAIVQVSAVGIVEDLVVLEASHVYMIDRAESLIRRALFDPGTVDVGESIRFELVLPFNYPSATGMMSSTTVDDIEIMVDEMRHRDRSVRLHQPGELDEMPRILDRGEVYVPEDGEGNPMHGDARIEFYVNHKGEVRLPRVLSSSDDEMALAAIATVSDMKFLPPTVDGEPAVTRVRMPYTTRP